MDFKKQLESELDKRYVDMLKGSSKPPFDKETVSNYQSFKNKNTSYHQRIDKEQREFNNALSEVTTRRNRRIEGENRAEYDRKKSKAHAKYVFAKFLKTIAMLLPVVLAIFVGIDIFSNKALYEVDHSFGWIVTGWVAFSLASLATTITLLIKLFSDESFEYEEYRSSYRSYRREDNRKKYAITATIVTIVVCLICCINFGTYIKWGMDEVDDLALKINMMPTAEEINYSEYEYQIEEAYTLYSSFDFWQKAMLKNEDRFLNVVAGFNQYRVDNVKSAMNLITLDSVSEGDILTNAVKLYSALNEEQRALLTQEEIKLFDTFSTVSNVVDRLYEINNDIIDQYGNIDDVLNTYQTIDDNYKAYVYNYDLVPEFRERYEYFEQFLFERIEGGGYTVKAKEGVRISGTLEIPEKYKGENVTQIPDYAFKDNYSIASVIVPETVTQIGVGAFQGCSNIQEMTLPFTGKSAEASAYEAVFGYIFGYTTKTSSASGTSRNTDFLNSQYGSVDGTTWQYTCKYASNGDYQSYFYYIPSSIQKVTITNQTNIQAGVFNGCQKIREIQYKQSVEQLNKAAFQNCTSLKKFNSEIDGVADLSGAIKEIGAYAFKNCTLINSVQMYDGLTTISDYAFENTKVTSVIVPDSVQTIQIGAFYGCSVLEELTLPFVGKSTEASAYEAVLGYIFGYTTKTSSASGTSRNTNFINTKYGSVDGATWQYSCKYASNGDYQSYFYYVPSALKTVIVTKQSTVPTAAFNGCGNLTTIKFNSVQNGIGDAAFQNCSSLDSFNTEESNTVNLSGKNSAIGNFAFAGCLLIENVIFDENVRTIGEYAFSNCSAVKEINLNNKITSIGAYAFQNVSIPNTVVVYDSTTYIGCGAFQGCTNIQEITLPFTGRSADASAYEAVFGFVFGYTTKSSSASGTSRNTNFINAQYGTVDGAIWQYSCKYASNGDNLSYFYYIPSSIRKVTITNQGSVQTAAFNGCNNIKNVTYTQTISSLNVAAFQNCTSLRTFNSTTEGTIDLNGTIKELGGYAFKNCSYINNIQMVEGLLTINEYAFENLSVRSVVVPTSVQTIQIGAFHKCNSIESITLPFVGKSADASAYEAVFGYIFGYTTKTSSASGTSRNTTFINTKYGNVDGATWQYSCKYASNGDNQSYFYYIPSTLRTVTITAQRNVPTAAFNGCTMLTRITYTQGVGSRGSYAFQNCNATVN